MKLKPACDERLVRHDWTVLPLTRMDSTSDNGVKGACYASGNKLADEIARRWNAHPKLVKALEALYASSLYYGGENPKHDHLHESRAAARAILNELNPEN